MNDHLEFGDASPFDETRRPGAIPPGILAKTPKSKHKDEFKTFHPRQFAAMDDKALAEWQSRYEKDEPQWRLAEHEFQIRGGRRTRQIAIAAIVISFLSFVLACLAYLLPHH